MPQLMPKKLQIAMSEYNRRFKTHVPYRLGWLGGSGLLRSIKDALQKNEPLPPDPEPKDPVTSINP